MFFPPILAVGFFAFNEAGSLQRNTCKQTSGPAVGVHSCSTPQSHISLHVPNKQNLFYWSNWQRWSLNGQVKFQNLKTLTPNDRLISTGDMFHRTWSWVLCSYALFNFKKIFSAQKKKKKIFFQAQICFTGWKKQNKQEINKNKNQTNQAATWFITTPPPQKKKSNSKIKNCKTCFNDQ